MAQLIPLDNIRKLAAQVDPREKLDADVEMMLLDLANDFIKDAATQACKLARHRGSDSLQVEDVMLPVDMKWKIKVPGFNQHVNSLSARLGVRKVPTRTHAAIVSTVRANIANDSKKGKDRKKYAKK
ncbi:hypothetical protein BCR33DRAFT_846592 [Rhizoclosmatium globosum]|uniref:Transcription initiation factor TFIID subunit 12 domain-containing protein n=1 Tax=Rhizoclosmatium globosum TaxID=329046 RepID=A0A1Y2CV86_9FUNG|nr:hypothetical protein HDU79_000934 [Rhizoclosmatium sp. JEL0117]KAJ3293226.1 hypothetical protein HDU79_000595 [Rhizoclosmatium sp. JEL0117]ORY50923.1 hypothetical protein BCR33DRAFT_846592 [Rhizoclosmatium globosum]|eukprot:ORY50923.1 hypothetical protein BCR33DRAFT_846592 [Rhizoclosmatium globosum]